MGVTKATYMMFTLLHKSGPDFCLLAEVNLHHFLLVSTLRVNSKSTLNCRACI
jgi:hypothetical protein